LKCQQFVESGCEELKEVKKEVFDKQKHLKSEKQKRSLKRLILDKKKHHRRKKNTQTKEKHKSGYLSSPP
jgi:hypothetical protein